MPDTFFMTQALRRSTIYLDPELHRALRIRAAMTDRSISDLVSDAVKLALAEDAEDLQALEERASEPDLLFETVVRALKADGKL
jgi:plasmid stability protein